MKRLGLLIACALFGSVSAPGKAEGRSQEAAATERRTNQSETDADGIPVTSDLVRQKCSPCHKADDKGRLTRISYRRTTPEGWEETIKRMVSLNGVKLDPADAREILRYLADHQGLAPEEARPAAFEVERRQIDYKYAADRDTEETCTRCHSMGPVISQRRTKEEWELLIAMHRGYYPRSDFQAFRRSGPPPRGQVGEVGRVGQVGRVSQVGQVDARHPMDKAAAHLAAAFPLNTPEWSAWAATMRPPRLEGTWALAGYEPGKGAVFGEIIMHADGGPDSGRFTTESTVIAARTGESITRRGRAIVYAGFQWRGKSDDWREVLFIEPDWRHASGRWFTGAYDEHGIDVHLERVERDPLLLGAAQPMLKAGVSGQELRLYGANLPATVAPGNVSLGAGVAVDRVVSASPRLLVLSVSISPEAVPGRRTVLVSGAAGTATVAVYRTIDFIKVRPQAGLARVGGINFPKRLQQFEAVAYAIGPDGKPDTGDDIELGLVDATWSLEEYTATYEDDDKDFVGTIDRATGLFTPNVDGPNPKRRHGTDNFGDVWVVATCPQQDLAAGATGSSGQVVGSQQSRVPAPLRARAHLLVTVPLYIKWDQPEVAW